MGDLNSGCTLFGSHNLERVLGSGGFGVVISSTHALEKKKYAIKLVPLHIMDTKRQTVLDEVSKISRLSSHENVVAYVTSWEHSFTKDELDNLLSSVGANKDAKELLCVPNGSRKLNVICIQMELCDENLKKWLKKRTEKTYDKDTNKSIFTQIVSGLKHIHDHGIIHRDLKPDNILLCISAGESSVTVKIGDFGYSAVHQQGDYSHTENAGASLFRAPEQSYGKYGKSVDVYAMGLILYLISEISTKDNFGKAVQDLKCDRISTLEKIEDPEIRVQIAALTEYQAEKRPSCGEILQKLHEINLNEAADGIANASIREWGCKHYERKCQIQCPNTNCSRWFWCRICHNEKVKGHVLDRFAVSKVKCLRCTFEQPVNSKCVLCNTTFAKYYCEICHLFDDSRDALELLFHCEDCGICRKRDSVGKLYNHCDVCNMCVPQGIRHSCSERAGNLNCNYCKKEIFSSTEATINVPGCGHYIHLSCFKKFPDDETKCPVCGNW